MLLFLKTVTQWVWPPGILSTHFKNVHWPISFDTSILPYWFALTSLHLASCLCVSHLHLFLKLWLQDMRLLTENEQFSN